MGSNLSTSSLADSLKYSLSPQGLLALVGSWILWKIVKAIVIKNPLHKLPGPQPRSYITGSVGDLFNADAWAYHESLEKTYNGVARIPGVMGGSMLYVYDPKALYHIMLKDKNSYDEDNVTIRTNGLVWGQSLIAVVGDHHRRQRKMLTPMFSVKYLRDIVPTFYNVGNKLRDSIKLEVTKGKAEFDLLEWMSRTALELIGQSGWGASFDDLQPDSDLHPYYKSMKDYMHFIIKTTPARLLVLPYFSNFGPPGLRRFIVDMFPWKPLHRLRDIVDTIHSTSLKLYKEKLQVLEKGASSSAEVDFWCLFCITWTVKANLMATADQKMPEAEIIAQMATITFAGMDTTSNALSRILDLLSSNQGVQDKLRVEIKEAKAAKGELSYDELHQLPYLDAVCRETLRLYPPAAFALREATEDVLLPLDRPVTHLDGKEATEIMVPRGTLIYISILASNRDPLTWGPDAHQWKPERWLSPLPKSVIDARIPGVYSHLMTFIGGNRACIGFKFSQLEMKVILCTLLESFNFSHTKKNIKWQFNGISQPTVDEPSTDGSENKLQLPLNVSLVA
ncbi:cytochrome P450 [Coprinopsis marcescibilis]|uniref:Cytochrome P450 n=1 Tax=Coprinopsis marcescibilis TaxID=230819 RepID=A0A5C3KWT4_COPMA|nr:cytochrome P450 [Coprinopsis marcescibilis]